MLQADSDHISTAAAHNLFQANRRQHIYPNKLTSVPVQIFINKNAA